MLHYFIYVLASLKWTKVNLVHISGTSQTLINNKKRVD